MSFAHCLHLLSALFKDYNLIDTKKEGEYKFLVSEIGACLLNSS